MINQLGNPSDLSIYQPLNRPEILHFSRAPVERQATGLTALDARENDFDLMGVQIEALKQGPSGPSVQVDVVKMGWFLWVHNAK